jgi:hypothetical protein
MISALFAAVSDRAIVSIAEVLADAPPPAIQTAPPMVAQIGVAETKAPTTVAKAALSPNLASPLGYRPKTDCRAGCECPGGVCNCEKCPIKTKAQPKANSKPATAGRFDGTNFYLKDASGQEWYGREWSSLWRFVWARDHASPKSATAATATPTRGYWAQSCNGGSCTRVWVPLP